MKLKGKTVIITGGAQGIGAATARRFADEGALVLIGDMNQDAGLAAVAEMRKEKGRIVHFHQLNVTDKASIKTFIDHALTLFNGRIDVLIDNAGITRDNFLSKMPEEDYDAVMNVNAKGPFLMMRALAPPMKQQEGGGAIINISSIVARMGNKGQVNYIASKSAVEGMTRAVALEYAPTVRINAIAPGFIETSMTAGIPEEVTKKFFARIPLGRFGKPDEIADAALYLATASYMTGHVLCVNGGMHLA